MVQYATIFAKKTFVGIVYKFMIMKDKKSLSFNIKNLLHT